MSAEQDLHGRAVPLYRLHGTGQMGPAIAWAVLAITKWWV